MQIPSSWCYIFSKLDENVNITVESSSSQGCLATSLQSGGWPAIPSFPLLCLHSCCRPFTPSHDHPLPRRITFTPSPPLSLSSLPYHLHLLPPPYTLFSFLLPSPYPVINIFSIVLPSPSPHGHPFLCHIIFTLSTLGLLNCEDFDKQEDKSGLLLTSWCSPHLFFSNRYS